MKYRAEIDGLRTLAVVPVVLFHFGFPWIAGGYLGVDVFFVISGFLISNIIINDVQSNKFSFVEFWSRRVRRIFPALIVMLAVTLSTVFLFSFRGDLRRFGNEGIGALLSFSNVMLWKSTGDYWGPLAQSSPLLHTWSLAVEEQFYFVYPFFTVLMLRYARRWFTHALSTISLISFLLYLYYLPRDPAATFFLLPTRAWELGCGGLLAVWRDSAQAEEEAESSLWTKFVAFLGLVAITTSYFVLSETNGFAWTSAIPVLGACLFIGFAKSESGVGRLLSLPPLVAVGKRSYSLYLWHWPVIVLLPVCYPQSHWARSPISWSLLIIVFSIISYEMIEKPTRRASLLSTRFLSCASLGIYALVIAFALRYHPPRYDRKDFSPVVWEGSSYHSASNEPWFFGPRNAHLRIGVESTPNVPNWAIAWKNGGIVKEYGDANPSIAVIGDSHALMWSGTIDRIAAELKVTTRFFAAYGTSPFLTIPVTKSETNVSFDDLGERMLYDKHRLEQLTKSRPKVVVLSTKWSALKSAPRSDLIEHLGRNGSKILLIQQPPHLLLDNRSAVEYFLYLGMVPQEGKRQYYNLLVENFDYLRGQKIVRDLCEQYPFCTAIEVEDLFVDPVSREILVIDGKNSLYIDDDHLSKAGSELLRDRLKHAIESALK